MIFKVKGIDKVTEIVSGLMVIITMGSGLMVIITMGPVATSVVDYIFRFRALDYSNWLIELSLQICKWSCVCHPVLP